MTLSPSIRAYTLDELKKHMRGDRYADMAPDEMVKRAASVRGRMRDRYAIAMRDDPDRYNDELWAAYNRARDEYIRLLRAYDALCGDLFPWEQAS